MLPRFIEYFFVCVGSLFLFISALGLWRLGDFFERIHAPTKAATLGLSSLFVATLFALGPSVLAKVILAVLFIGTTAPVGAHYLTSTAYRVGVRPKNLLRDEYASLVKAQEQSLKAP